jgi:hypothetical protein
VNGNGDMGVGGGGGVGGGTRAKMCKFLMGLPAYVSVEVAEFCFYFLFLKKSVL